MLLALLRDRARSGALASIGLSFAALLGVFLFLTFYLQRSLALSPVTTGLAILPLTVTTLVTAGVVRTRLLPPFGTRPLVATGMALGTLALLSFSRLTPGGTTTPASSRA